MNDQEPSLPPHAQLRLLREMWASHDARWYMATTEAYGFDASNHLNVAVLRSMGRTEMRGLLRALGLPRIRGADEVRPLLAFAVSVFLPEGHMFRFDAEAPDVVLGRVEDCYVYPRVARTGALPSYRCPGAARGLGWLEALGLAGRVEGDRTAQECAGRCTIRYLLAAEGERSPSP